MKQSSSQDIQSTINAFRQFVLSKGWTIVDEKEIQSGYQIAVSDGVMTIPTAFFKSGKILVQGKPGTLQTEIKSWGYGQPTASSQLTLPVARQSQTPTTTLKATGIARIGTDESGKGDYFGPLVIAAVYVDEQSESRLIALGVRDSKLLPDNRILTLADEIKKIASGRGTVRLYTPERYNELYKETPNLNLLLARAHAQAIESVLKKVSCSLAIVDQFGNESLVRDALVERGIQITLEQRTHAEDDTAVAAASIVARAEFVRQIEQLSHQVGKTLPKGAWDPNIVKIGREIVAKGGQSELAKVAKLHFKITETIFQS